MSRRGRGDLQQLPHDAEREVPLERPAAGAQQPQLTGGAAAALVEDRRLADARRPLDQDDGAAAARGGSGGGRDGVELPVAFQRRHSREIMRAASPRAAPWCRPPSPSARASPCRRGGWRGGRRRSKRTTALAVLPAAAVKRPFATVLPRAVARDRALAGRGAGDRHRRAGEVVRELRLRGRDDRHEQVVGLGVVGRRGRGRLRGGGRLRRRVRGRAARTRCPRRARPSS